MRLRIAKWYETYEVRESRRPKGPMQWYAVPVTDGGIGIKLIERHPEGMAYYGVWNRLCHTTAKLDDGQRGLLVRGNGQPYSVEDLCLLHGGGPVDLWERAIAFFLQPRPGWLIDEDAVTATRKEPSLVAPPPPIEQPSIYELAADRMIRMYQEAGAAEASRLCAPDALRRELWEVCDGPNAEKLLALIEGNLARHIAAATKPDKLKTLSSCPKDPRALAPLPPPKADTSKQDSERLQAEIESAWLNLTAAERKTLLDDSRRQWANHIDFDENFALAMAKTEAWSKANEYLTHP